MRTSPAGCRRERKDPRGAGHRHRGKTEDAVRQKNPLTRCTDKTGSCSPSTDIVLPTNLVPHVCSAQFVDRVDQLGIFPGRHRRRRAAKKRPYCRGRFKQGLTIPVIVSDRWQPRIIYPFGTPTYDTVRPDFVLSLARMHHKVVGNFKSKADVRRPYFRR